MLQLSLGLLLLLLLELVLLVDLILSLLFDVLNEFVKCKRIVHWILQILPNFIHFLISFDPHEQRFEKYSEFLYWNLVILHHRSAPQQFLRVWVRFKRRVLSILKWDISKAPKHGIPFILESKDIILDRALREHFREERLPKQLHKEWLTFCRKSGEVQPSSVNLRLP